MAYANLIPQHTAGASVQEAPDGGYGLSIPAGTAGSYRLAQLDDYAKKPRGQFPLRPPLSLSLSARASSATIPGTWGFGVWNYPFGMSLGFGGTGWRLPALPNAAWFFGASEESYLSFKESRSRLQRDNGPHVRHATGVTYGAAANGFLAQAFRSPRFHPLLIPAGLALPFSRKTTRRLLGRIIAEEGIDLRRGRSLAPNAALESSSYTGIDVTRWHHYRLDWREMKVTFFVDGHEVFASDVSPRPPLGLVIWIDNQYAAFTPAGKVGFGLLTNPEPAWLEVKEINVARDNIPQARDQAG